MVEFHKKINLRFHFLGQNLDFPPFRWFQFPEKTFSNSTFIVRLCPKFLLDNHLEALKLYARYFELVLLLRCASRFEFHLIYKMCRPLYELYSSSKSLLCFRIFWKFLYIQKTFLPIVDQSLWSKWSKYIKKINMLFLFFF